MFLFIWSKKPGHQNGVTGYPELQIWPLPAHPTRKSRQPLKVSGSATPDPPQPPPLHTSFQSGQPEMKAAYHRNRDDRIRSEEHTSELQSRGHLVCRLLLEKKKDNT